MSHLSKVQVAIRDIDVLGEALRAIGLRRVAEVPENYEFAGTFNTCDVIAVNAVNRVMAFKFVDGEAELHSNLEPGDFAGLCLIDVQGGEFDNVIRSNCAAAVAIPVSCRKEFEVFVSSFGATLQNEYADTDANVTVSCEDTEAKAAHLCRGYRRASACSYDITEWG